MLPRLRAVFSAVINASRACAVVDAVAMECALLFTRSMTDDNKESVYAR